MDVSSRNVRERVINEAQGDFNRLWESYDGKAGREPPKTGEYILLKLKSVNASPKDLDPAGLMSDQDVKNILQILDLHVNSARASPRHLGARFTGVLRDVFSKLSGPGCG